MTPTTPSASFELSRRQLLTATSLTALGLYGAAATYPSSAAAAAAQWPGHQPGRVYLGMSTGESLSTALRATGPVGLYRTYYRWNDGTRENRNIAADHAARRMPWISFKPPTTGPGGWAAVASGRHDGELRARARRYAGFARPVIVTFNHEPHNDNTGTPADFARAWCRVHDIMKSETGLKNVVSAPILGEWVWNPYNKRQDPADFITGAVLDRCHFLGVDLYQNNTGQGYDERLGRVLSWLNGRGRSTKMVGIGETGATDGFGSPGGREWWSEQWAWTQRNTSRIGAISYFNSTRNNNLVHNWKLSETQGKLSAYKSSLSSSTATRLS